MHKLCVPGALPNFGECLAVRLPTPLPPSPILLVCFGASTPHIPLLSWYVCMLLSNLFPSPMSCVP